MASPDQLARRVERNEEDLRAAIDTVVDIREVQQQHTTTLAKHGRTLEAIENRLAALETRVAEGFAEILAVLRKD
jgi:hypothetical protein